MTDDDDLTEGRVRRGRTIVVAVLGLALLGALPFLSSLAADDEVDPGPAPTGPEAPAATIEERLDGRLVYTAIDPDRAGHLRLWVWDLTAGTVAEGPAIPVPFSPQQGTYDLYAAGPEREWVVLLRYAPRTAAYVLGDLEAAAPPVQVARADGVTISSDRLSLLALEPGSGGPSNCPDPPPRLLRVDLATGAVAPAFRGRLPCGSAFGFVMVRSTPVIGIADLGPRTSPRSYLLGPDGPEPLFRGPFPVAAAGGTVVFADRSAGMSVWPGGGAPRPVVTGSEVVGRLVSVSDGGRYLAVAGSVDGVTGVWILDASAGSVRLGHDLLPSISSTLDVAFAVDGTVFVLAWEGVLVSSGGTVRSLPLPPGAPEPRGAAVWLP